MARRLLAGLALAACLQQAGADTLDVAWWKDGKLSALRLADAGASDANAFDGSRMVPLGSLWKLFVYVYADQAKLPTPDYTCTGQRPNDEVYCCETGQRVGRDAALAQSCGLFFAPARLNLTRRPWQAYWQARLGQATEGQFAWLADPATLAPEKMVRLDALLKVLASLPAASRADAETALLHVVLGGRGADSVRYLGSQLRVKTYSWHEQNNPQRRLGGAAGWLTDGTPLWFGGADTSHAIMQKWAPRLVQVLPAADAGGDGGCVLVDFFARYPLRSVSGPQGPATPGSLVGRHSVQFENGNALAFTSHGEMVLERDADGRAHLQGRMSVNEYVARVIDREGSTAAPEAAKALAIAARSYLQQNAVAKAGCQQIADSSARQRVSPNAGSANARALARWTDQLVLAGPQVRYHSDRAAPNTLVWRSAVEQAGQGRRFDDILAAAYPSAELTTIGGGIGLRCVRLAPAEAWLKREIPRWEKALRAEAGYERPAEAPFVCELASGLPYSEQSRNRIFVRQLSTREDRITLAHEYVHLGLRGHPHGQDEALVERIARRLVDLNLEAM